MFADYEDGALAGSAKGLLRAQHPVLAADFTMRPEIAAQRVIEGADLTLPGRGVHDGVHADAHDLGVPHRKFFALHLVGWRSKSNRHSANGLSWFG